MHSLASLLGKVSWHVEKVSSVAEVRWVVLRLWWRRRRRRRKELGTGKGKS